jgi:hypothetical protein
VFEKKNVQSCQTFVLIVVQYTQVGINNSVWRNLFHYMMKIMWSVYLLANYVSHLNFSLHIILIQFCLNHMLYAKWHLQITHFNHHLITIIDGRTTTKLNKQKEKNIEQWHSWNMKFDLLIGNNKFKQKQRLMMQLYICNDVAIGCFYRCQSPCHINSSIIQNRLYMHRYIVWKTKIFNWTLFEKCIFICKNVHSIKH